MNKNKILTILLSVIGVLALIILWVVSSQNFHANSDGVITVEFVDINKEIIKSEDISFNENDSLIELIEDNFNNVKFVDGMLMEIEDYVTPADWSTFISIYVDGEMSMVGMADIVFEDGTKISLIITQYNSYE